MLEHQNSMLCGMAFESYVINVLVDYLSAQSKEIKLDGDICVFDGFLPDGIDNIPGPVHLEIKSGFSNKSGYFRSIERFAHHACSTSPGALLVILGIELKDDVKLSMTRLVESRSKRKAYVWDLTQFNVITNSIGKKYQDYMDNPTKALVDAAINNPQNKQEAANTKQIRISALKREYDKEELSLFLGAGISKDAGIPQWNELINALLSKMIVSRIKDGDEKVLSQHLDTIIDLAHQNQENSPITQMRYIKGAFAPKEYNKLVHDVLYSKHPKANTALLRAIAEICTPRRNHIGVQGIVTYNFDDLLERCLKKQKVQINTIAREEDISVADKLSVYHVHGFMPKEYSEDNTDTELIFSEEDYHKVYRDAYCWSNLAQLNFLREHTCLFIGCSLTDPNLRRLLDVARRNNEKPRHYAIMRRISVENRNGVNQKALEIYEDIDLSLREKYYAAMGINIIWVDTFNEIPQILHSLI